MNNIIGTIEDKSLQILVEIQGAGPKGEKGDKGDKGEQGADGHTPIRGTDYWTADDIASIQAYIDTEILGGVS